MVSVYSGDALTASASAALKPSGVKTARHASLASGARDEPPISRSRPLASELMSHMAAKMAFEPGRRRLEHALVLVPAEVVELRVEDVRQHHVGA